ncbi:5'-nucleotidase [Lutibacter sp.]|uniref:5'-nucleotidase C-terminal domain-containing protein n=1 Tax=Lutibacter sp. TaxID=1925666 RepID=UPI0025B7F8D7|nr:5'-nucleotidase [Lutibacter sp.]MCF6167762.1 5'-nucleotidase C-terminal domain-containing protein [Lutibacter sp.]
MKKIIISIFTIVLFFSCKNEPQHLLKIEGKLLPITSEITSNKNIETFVKPYRERIEKEMSNILSYTPINLTREDGELESTLGNLMADMCYQEANPIFNKKTGKNIDFALFNFGGVRASIPKGNITMQHAFNLMPFENQLVVVELSSEKIKELITYLIHKKKAHPISKQVSLVYTNNGYNFKINGKPLNDSKTYFVLTSDYLQHGGDHMDFFKNPINLYKTDYKLRNAIIDYFKETDTIKVKLDGRIRTK